METPAIHTVVAEIAGRQAGCVSRRGLLAAGLRDTEIETLLRRKALISVIRGIYLYGTTTLSQAGLWWAAVLVGGAGARLGERSALEAQSVLTPNSTRAVVTHPRRSGHPTRTFRTRVVSESGRPATIVAVPINRCDGYLTVPGLPGLPIDTALRAIDDLAAAGEIRELRKAWREADYRGLLRAEEVEAHLGRGSEGAEGVRELLAANPLARADDLELLSRDERDLFEGIREAGLPAPRVNQLGEFGGRFLRPDFWFVLARLIVEVDGPGHRLPARQAEDADRDAHLASVGIEVLRFTELEVRNDLAGCIRRIAQRLDVRLAA